MSGNTDLRDGIRAIFLVAILTFSLFAAGIPAGVAAGDATVLDSSNTDDEGEIHEVTDELNVWDRAWLPFRADTDAAAHTIRSHQVFVNAPDFPTRDIRRDEVAVYEPGTTVTFDFETVSPGANTESFADRDAQVVLAKLDSDPDGPSELPRSIDAAQELLTKDNLNDNASFEFIEANATLDENGELRNIEYEIEEPGQYAAIVAIPEAGEGFVIEDGAIDIDGEVTVIGGERLAAHVATGDVTAPETAILGDDIEFAVDASALPEDENITHGVAVYDEETLANEFTTINITDNVSFELDAEDIIIEHNIIEIRGIANFDGNVTVFGEEVEAEKFEGTYEIADLIERALDENDEDVDKPERKAIGDAILDASATIVPEGDQRENVSVGTLEEWEDGEYRWVYTASTDNKTEEFVTNAGTIELQSEHTLNVTVEDQDESGIADATVTVDGLEEVTDADGLVSFDLVDGEYEVTAEKDGYESVSQDVTIDGADEELTLTLGEQHDLNVTVEDEEGTPLEEVEVSVDDREEMTDADGFAQFALVDGEYTVTAGKDGYVTASETVTIDGDGESVTITLHEVEHELEVTVVDDDGNPLQGANVSVNELESITDGEGVSLFEVVDGEYSVTAEKDGYVTASETVTIDGADVSITLTLHEEEHELGVTVEDEAGNALEDAEVSVNGLDAHTDADGLASFMLVNGEYEVTAEKDGYNAVVQEVTIAGEDKSITIALQETEHELSVAVEDENGNALEDATVRVNSLEELTDAAGLASFMLADGEYGVTAEKDGYNPASQDVTIDGDDEAITITLQETEHQLAVTVEDEDGNALEDATVRVNSLEGLTDAAGLASFMLVNGEYEVIAEMDGYDPVTQDVTIDGDDEAITITLQETEHELAVTVEDEDGNGLEDAEVSVNGLDSLTNADGLASFMLVNGEYEVIAEMDGYDPATQDVTIDGADEEITITLEPIPDVREIPGIRVADNRASTTVSVLLGERVNIRLPSFTIGEEDGVEFTDGNFTSIADINAQIDFEQTREAPDGIPSVPTAAGGQSYLELTYPDGTADQVDEVEFKVRISQDRLANDDRELHEVVFFRYDDNGEWEMLEAEHVRTTDDKEVFRVQSPGLSVYTMSYGDAAFEIVDTELAPDELTAGESADVSAVVENTGDVDGTFVGDLVVDGEVVATQEVEIAAGETEAIEYTHQFDEPGTFDVELNDEYVGEVTVNPAEHTLIVNVVDEDDNAIEDAKVTINGDAATTGEDGSVQFELEDGTYTVNASAIGFADASQEVTIDGDDKSVTIILEDEDQPISPVAILSFLIVVLCLAAIAGLYYLTELAEV